MAERTVLVPGERVPLVHGGSSPLVYVSDAENSGARRRINVQCGCGNIFSAELPSVRANRAQRCDACNRVIWTEQNKKDKTGQRFGRLVVERRARTDHWECVCDCGNRVVLRGCKLTTGHTTSCGCYNREINSKRLGHHWPVGSEIGCFTILEQVTRSIKNRRGLLWYRVYDAIEQRERVLDTKAIRRFSTELGRVKERLRGLWYSACRRQKLPRQDTFVNTFGYTREYAATQLGDFPGPGWHLDHVCPTTRAESVADLVALFAVENLRWLPGPENSSKNHRWTPEGARLHEKLLGRPWPEPERKAA